MIHGRGGDEADLARVVGRGEGFTDFLTITIRILRLSITQC